MSNTQQQRKLGPYKVIILIVALVAALSANAKAQCYTQVGCPGFACDAAGNECDQQYYETIGDPSCKGVQLYTPATACAQLFDRIGGVPCVNYLGACNGDVAVSCP